MAFKNSAQFLMMQFRDVEFELKYDMNYIRVPIFCSSMRSCE